MSSKKISLALTLLFILSGQACGLKHAATSVTAGVISDGMSAVEMEEDVFVAKETSLPLIKTLEVFSFGDSKNKKMQFLLSKSYGNYAFGVAELEAMKEKGAARDEWLLRAKRYYAKGLAAGLIATANGKKNLNEVTQKEFESVVKKIDKKSAERFFWLAFNWGQTVNLNRDDISIVADLPRVEMIVDRVAEVAPDFQCGIANAFKGALIASNPLRTGANPEAAKPYFERAMAQCDGKYLLSKVMFAEWYATAAGDAKLFKETLTEVIASDAAQLPRYRLAGEIAKGRAALLLAASPKQ